LEHPSDEIFCNVLLFGKETICAKEHNQPKDVQMFEAQARREHNKRAVVKLVLVACEHLISEEVRQIHQRV
jgi:hypothetical protein